MSQDFIAPVEQANIVFFQQPVIAVRLSDGRIGAVFSDMCSILKMDVASQVRRLREDETTNESLVQVLIQTANRGQQVMGVLVAWAIPYWLSGIQLARIKDPEKREAIAYFKKEAANILYAHFSQKTASLPEPSRAVVPVEPTAPASDANAATWAEYHRQMVLFYEWKATTNTRLEALEGWQDNVEARLESHEQVLGLVSEMLDRLGSPTITPTHQNRVKYYVSQLSQQTGQHPATIYSALYTAFDVPRYQELPEAEWERVERWFQTQLRRKK